MTHLPALPAQDVWHAWSRLTLYAVEPLSTMTVGLDAGGLRTGDVAGLALSGGFFAWVGVERVNEDLMLAQSDVQSGTTSRVALGGQRVWLRAECDFVRRQAAFSYSTDGSRFRPIGEPSPMGEGPVAAGGFACSLFCCATKAGAGGGHADFERFVLTTEPAPHLNGPR
jgi:hypothetical protein